MKVFSYITERGTDLIAEYIEKLPLAERIDGMSVLENLEAGRFERLTIKRWRKKVYEVYFYKHNRIFYVVVEDERIYLLHACRKQKNSTETKDSRIVIARAKDLGREMGKVFI